MSEPYEEELPPPSDSGDDANRNAESAEHNPEKDEAMENGDDASDAEEVETDESDEEEEQEDLDEKIPSSGLDAVLSSSVGESVRWSDFITRAKESLPTYNGYLGTDVPGKTVPFHLVRIDTAAWDAEQAHNLAMLAARLSCDVIDVFRGKQKPARVEHLLTKECMRKLMTASELLVNHMRNDARLYAKYGLLPVDIFFVNGWLTSPTRFECSALLSIGNTKLSCNTSFIYKGSIWKCAVADFG